jgi:hypothetical protein
MEISVTPDTYTPSVDSAGNYIDHVPYVKHGMFCPCASRKEKAYETSAKFNMHTKTKAHQKWLQMLNQNKANHYLELVLSKELVENQQKIIAQLELQLQKKSHTIDYLTEQLRSNPTPTVCAVDDLLGIN